MKIYLGSSSPRRKEIIGNIFNIDGILSPDIDESAHSDEKATDYVMRMATEKLLSIKDKLPEKEEYIAIGCDTTVSFENHILGKPVDHADALRMFKLLSGKKHQVYTSISLLYHNHFDDDKILTEIEKTDVEFKDLAIEEIERYLSSIHYLDKAGAYAIQENSELIIKGFSGSTTNVIGFPLSMFFRMLDDIGTLEKILTFNVKKI